MTKKDLDLEKISKVKLYYDSAHQELTTKLNIINTEFNTLYSINPINHIKTRIKSLPSIIDKLKRKKLEININNTFTLTDVVAARIVCNFVDDIYQVIEKIKNNHYFNIIEEKDYITTPKNSGYRGYHLIIEIPVTINNIKKIIKCEIQLRTTAMDFWASSEHTLNYKKVGITAKDKLELKRISDELWHIDIIMNMLAKKNKPRLELEKNHRDIDANEIKSYVKWRKQNELYEQV